MSEVGKKSKPIAKRSKKKKDPNAPKRPRSAYILFCAQERPNVKKDNPDAKPADILKLLAERWKTISESDKKDFAGKASDDKDRYSDEMQHYAPPADAGSDDEDGGGRRKKGKKEKGSRKKKKKDPNEPKKPQTAYLIFGNKERSNIKAEHPEMKQSEIMKQIGIRWNTLDPANKKPFIEMASADKERYERERSAYERTKNQKAPSDDEEDMGSAQGNGDDGGDDDDMDDDEDDAEDDD